MSVLDPKLAEHWLKRLLARPARVEPGMLLQAQPITMRSGAEIPLHGIDLLGRPCLFGLFDQMNPDCWDWVLEVITSFREGIEGTDPVYQRGREPRLFLLCREWQVEDFARLRFFHQTVGVRGYRMSESGGLELCFPAVDSVAADAWIGQVQEGDRPFIQRLLAAAGRGGNTVQVLGGVWPLNLVNEEGPFASLHQGDSGLLMSVPVGQGQYRVLDLNVARDRDLAIDSVMRHRIAVQKSL
jgi:hypothetical protein